jgi:hypothetical protein
LGDLAGNTLSTLHNYNAIYHDGIDHGGAKKVPGLVVIGRQRLIDTDIDEPTGRDDQTAWETRSELSVGWGGTRRGP